MEVNSSSGKIEKFNGRPGTISLRGFKATFSIVVCELELKYGVNYTEAFAFKQLAHYVHYEALDVYEQHSARILGVTQILNPAYATATVTASQVALHITRLCPYSILGTYLNKPFSSTTHYCYRKHSSHHQCANFCWSSGEILSSSWIGISSQKFWKNSATRHLLSAKGWNPQDVLQEASQTQRGYPEHHRLRSCPLVSSFVGRYSNTPCEGFTMGFCRIWKLIHFVRCVQDF